MVIEAAPIETPTEISPVDWKKVNIALDDIFQIFQDDSFNNLELDIIANSIWTRITVDKLTMIAAQNLAVHMATLQYDKKTDRQSYHG